MPRLINPGIGEVCDRLTILALKILHSAARGRDVGHFEQERNALLAQLRGRTLNGAWFEQVIDLSATNAAIWYGEDALRTIRSHDPNSGLMEEAGRIGCRQQELNDQRNRLVEAINKLTGDHLGSEKL